MSRFKIDCRQAGGACTMAFEADSPKELLATVMPHAEAVHNYPNNAETKANLKSMVQEVVTH